MSFDNKFVKYFFKSEWDNELTIAFLSQLPFDSFEETDDGIIAFIPSKSIDDEFLLQINRICKQYKLEYSEEEIQNRNWNKEWESSFEPVSVNSFCLIKADFHNVDDLDYKYVINITPEMTFGTGHHETTYMMIELISDLFLKDKDVFDYGSGTGILAILAKKMGANNILAVDNDPIAIENIRKNAITNNCENIDIQLNDSAAFEKFNYDVVLANINRNVLEKEAENLSLSLRKGGFLLLSGILITDKEFITKLYERNSMKLMNSIEKGIWSSLKFVAY